MKCHLQTSKPQLSNPKLLILNTSMTENYGYLGKFKKRQTAKTES